MSRPAYLLVFVLVWLQTRSCVAQTTPSKEKTCSCVAETTVNCSSLGLTRVPRCPFPPNITALILYNNSIAAVGPEDFAQYASLTLIDLSRNVISNIREDAFAGLESLRRLNLSFNRLDLQEGHFKETPRPFANLTLLSSLDLSHNRLTILSEDLFFSLNCLRTLNLSYNNLSLTGESLSSPFCFLYNLTHLDLSRNAINQLHANTFFGLSALRWLSLTNNSIPLNANAYPKDVFKSMKSSLNSLHLEGNCDAPLNRNGSLDYPDTALSVLTDLRSLYMDGIPKAMFGPGFARMVNLTLLSLSGLGNGVCYMNKLTNETFDNLRGSLRYLDLSYCNLRRIEPSSFAPLSSSLEVLDLSSNTALGFDKLGIAMYGLQHSALRELHINHIVHAYSLQVKVTPKNTRYFKNTRIESIFAKNNNLEVFCDGALGNMPDTLTRVNLNENRLTFGSYFKDLVNLTNLTEIEMDGHPFPFDPPTHYPPDEADGCSATSDEATSDEATSDEAARECGRLWSPFLARIDKLRGDDSKTLDSTGEGTRHLNTGIIFKLPPKLTKFRSRYNQLYYRLHNMKFDPENSLTSLDFNSNLLTSWFVGMEGLSKLNNLDLSNNLAFQFDYEFFKGFPDLITLNGSKNLLRRFLQNDVKGEFFGHLNKLEELVLQWNYINRLPEKVFQGLTRLEHLDLSHNEMGRFDVNISHMQSLTLLNLSDNSIDFLPERVTDHLDAMAATGGKIQIDLTSNRLTCTCKELDFLKWVHNTKVKFAKLGTYMCRMANGTKITLQKDEFFDFIADFETDQCSGPGLLVLAGAGCFCLLTAILSAIAYRYRWKLRYLYYITRIAYTKINSQQNDDFHFDAFVSYAWEDSDFVHRQLIDELETRAGLCLNIHSRDFTPGRPISCNVVDAIQNSRRTLVVLSRQLLQSDWCIFELQMAMMEAAHTGRDVVIFLLYEDLPNEEIPRKVFYYLKVSTFVTYPSPSDPGSLNHFWRRLALAIKQN